MKNPRSPHSGTKQNSVQELSKDIAKLVKHLQPVIQQAEALGIFTADRELLECPNCGMFRIFRDRKPEIGHALSDRFGSKLIWANYRLCILTRDRRNEG